MTENTHNWSNNLTYHPARWHHPENLEQLQALVEQSQTVKAIGTHHSFNTIADTTGDMISLSSWDEMTLDRDAHTVTVGAGVRYGTLAHYLDAQGFALHNLASLPHISVVGACATATHGSGVGNGNLATSVRALEIVQADGAVVTLAPSDPDFAGAVVNLGALGIVTRITLAVEPTYTVRQVVYRNLPFTALYENFEQVVSAAYSLSLFTDWREPRFTQVWQKHRADAAAPFTMEPTWFGAQLASGKMHPIEEVPAANCTEQEGIPGPWHERLPHFKMQFTPSHGEELQTEYFVPRTHGPDAIRAVFALREAIAPLLLVTEVRTVASDTLWLSPNYERDSLALHFTWKPDEARVRDVLPRLEAALAPFQARPHWAKLFVRSGSPLRSLYPRIEDFIALRKRYDPQGKFENDFLRSALGASR